MDYGIWTSQAIARKIATSSLRRCVTHEILASGSEVSQCHSIGLHNLKISFTEKDSQICCLTNETMLSISTLCPPHQRFVFDSDQKIFSLHSTPRMCLSQLKDFGYGELDNFYFYFCNLATMKFCAGGNLQLRDRALGVSKQ